jgi:hypothetical protein
MDPFLEHPDIFPDVHSSLNFCLREALQAELRPPYYAVISRRAWIEVSLRYIEPDVHVRHRQDAAATSKTGGVAVARKARNQPTVVHVPHDERKQDFIEVYARHGSDKRLVTAIEILSLANKTAGEQGRDLYLRKQQELLGSRVHLVEIDLLRAGDHTTAVPLALAQAKAGPFDYHVCIHRFDKLEDFLVYPIQLEERLPEIEIPLLPDADPAIVDLQAVLDRCYQAGPYAYEINYQAETLVPPLPRERARWAAEMLQAKSTAKE